MIAERLAGKRIAITGATGFLGTAIVERLFRQVPDCEIVLLVRPGKRSTPAERARREIFRNDAFDRVMTSLGRSAYNEEVERRVTVIAGDVSSDGLGLDDEGRRVLASCDVVIHSAATVSFDAPLDGAVEVNLMGPTRIVQTLQDLGVAPHVVAVSTCYVAGNRRGPAPEMLLTDSPFHIDVDWRAEVVAARRARGDIDAESRSTPHLQEFRARAGEELGAAGTPLLAAKTEQLRQRWVSDQLADAGRARAASLGWPDAYAYTKSLGERALVESRGDVPVSIVRPSIIESALAEPRPGWIRGFRMAEPIILSYARGLLKEFPGVPEGVVDVIPVDLVVAAILMVAAGGPRPEVEVVQVASGTRNPLHYRQIVDLVRTWFSEHPVYDAKGQPIAVPEWSFPGRGAVQRQLKTLRRNLDLADRALKTLPLRGPQAQWNASIEDKRDQVERAIGYVELYGAYAESEALFGVERLLQYFDELPPEDRAAFASDPAVIDWDDYIQQVHLPSIITHARVKTTPERSDPDARQNRLRARVLAPARQLAAFDLENTIIASNVVASYSFLATRRMGPAERARFLMRTLAEGPSLLALDKRDRTDFLRHFYRRYADAPVAMLDADAQRLLSEHILPKAFPAAVRRVREHRALGHRTVLITGALEFVVRPLAPLFDDVVAAELTIRDGAYTGELASVPPTGEVRAQALRDYAAAHDIDLAESVAYADSSSDLPLLDAVGFPVAVNPETRLATIASKRGWLVEEWTKAPGSSDRLLPFSPLPSRRRSRR